jgi:hypothetical protein
MNRWEWEALGRHAINPALEAVAAMLNARGDIFAEVSKRPLTDGCLLRIRGSTSPVACADGFFVVNDDPESQSVRVEEADTRIKSGQPVTRACLPQSEVTVSSIEKMALAFADRFFANV